MRRTGSVAVVLSLALLATAAHAQSRRSSLTTSSTSRSHYSLLGGETVPTGVDVASGEFGYPGISFGLTHGTSATSDIGVKFDILYGFENTTDSEFGIGVRVPFRFAAYRKDRIGVLFHIDPGIKFYTTNPAAFGFQWPIGVTLGYTVGPELTIGLNTRFGPMIETAGGNTRFGFVTQLLLAYRL